MNIELQTKRLVLKQYALEDLTNLNRLLSEPLIWEYSSKTAITDIDAAKAQLYDTLRKYEEDQCAFQALYQKDTNQYIGEAGVLAFNKQCNRAVLGYNLLPAYWGRGYATEITKALVRYLFETIQVERIEALAANNNIASKRVLENSGFICEGLLRNFGFIHGTLADVSYYGMIKDDYFKLEDRPE